MEGSFHHPEALPALTGKVAGELLRRNRESLLLRWAERARREVGAARRVRGEALRDSLPTFLDALAASFTSPAGGAHARTSADEHGDDRFDTGRYTLSEVIYEYHLLREELVSFFESAGRLDPACLRGLHAGLDQAIRHASERSAARELEARGQLKAEHLGTERLLGLALESAQMGTWQVDLATLRLTTCAGTHRIFSTRGLEGDLFEVLARTVHPDDLEDVKAVWREAVRTGASYVHEYRIRRPDGSVRWVLSRGGPDKASTSEARFFSGVTADITDRREAELRGSFERHKLEALFRDAPAAMALLTGPELIFEMLNPQYQAIFPGRALAGRSLEEAVPELREQEFPELLRSVLRTGQTFIGHEMRVWIAPHLGAPTEARYYDFSYTRVRDREGRPYAVYIHAVDVSDRVLAREELRVTVKKLELERELRERFVAALTHDLRTPLTAARLAAQIAARRAAEPESVRRQTEKVLRGLDRCERMIQDLLDASRLKAGEGLPLEREEASVRDLVRAVVEEQNEMNGGRVRYPDSGVEICAYFDPSAFRRVLENLLGNAAKYGQPGTPITVRSWVDAVVATVTVHNEGAPIAPPDQLTLFDPYRRTAEALAGGKKGWGIGLTLVKGLTEAHGGSVGVESSAGAGTTFRVSWPLRPAMEP